MLRSDAPKKRTSALEEQVDSPALKRKAADSAYQVDDKILCRFDSDGQKYEAKIIGLVKTDKGIGYQIHYQGWNKRYDEVVPEEDAKKRFTRFDADVAKKAVAEQKKARKTSGSVTIVKHEKSATPASARKRQSESKGSAVKAASEQTKFDDFITADLAFVLCEESENVSKNQKLPKVPADISIKNIVQKFLESKGILADEEFENELENVENIFPEKLQPNNLMVFLLNLFDLSFLQMLVYENEKTFFFNDFLKDDESAIKRYSSSLGFTFLLRFIACLSNILNKAKCEAELQEKFVDNVKELCIFLQDHIDEYYPESYYKTI